MQSWLCSQNQQLEMYRDYVGLLLYLRTLAEDAVNAIRDSLND